MSDRQEPILTLLQGHRDGTPSTEGAVDLALSMEAPATSGPFGPGRSSLLRAGLAPARRRRRRLLRMAIHIVVALCLWWLAAAVAGRELPFEGPGLLIYRIHDSIWLPLRGEILTRAFPFSLAWLVPAGGLAILLFVEYLTPLAPLRRFQVRTLRFLLRRPTGAGAVLSGAKVMRNAAGRPRLAHAVARDLLRTQADKAVDALWHAEGRDPRQLLRAATTTLRLSDGDAASRVEALEAATLAILLGAAPAQLAELGAAVARAGQGADDKGEPWIARLLAAPLSGEARDVPRNLRLLILATPFELACATLLASRAIHAEPWPEALAWFDRWAILRGGADASRAAALAEAEGLVRFEFWAALAERAVAEAEASGPADLMDRALPGLRRIPARGEQAAYGEPSA